jgi:DNA-binding transcriptional MerR regulator
VADRNLMPIGRFARSCRLSVKALRHYDELGLLEPAFVDPQSRYRYYSRDQARDAVMIGMLRSLELPLAVIRSALAAAPADLKTLIDAETARIEAEVAARERTLLSLRHLAKSGELVPYDIGIEELEGRRVARLSATTDAGRLVADTTALIRALFDELSDREVVAREPVLTINTFADGEDRVDVQACIGLERDPRVPGRAEIVDLAGGAFACLTHEGPYETLGLAHHALFAWAQEHGHTPLGPVWELYANDPADVRAEALVTRVALPLEPH